MSAPTQASSGFVPTTTNHGQPRKAPAPAKYKQVRQEPYARRRRCRLPTQEKILEDRREYQRLTQEQPGCLQPIWRPEALGSHGWMARGENGNQPSREVLEAYLALRLGYQPGRVNEVTTHLGKITLGDPPSQ